MKTPFSVILLLLGLVWISTANPTVEDDRNNSTEAVTNQPFTTETIDTETKAPVEPENEIEQALAKEPETANVIETGLQPTKRPKRPHSGNKRPALNEHKPHHHHEHLNPMALSEPWPYYPMAPAQMPYPLPFPPCSYPPPMYYPMPMYSPYFYPSYPIQKKNPVNILESDTVESSDSAEEVNAEEFLRNANFWNNKFANKEVKGNNTVKANSTTTVTKPTKRFIIRNWITNKINKKTTPAPST